MAARVPQAVIRLLAVHSSCTASSAPVPKCLTFFSQGPSRNAGWQPAMASVSRISFSQSADSARRVSRSFSV